MLAMTEAVRRRLRQGKLLESNAAAGQPTIIHANIPAGEPHHMVYPRVSASTRVVGVLAALAASAAHSARAISAPRNRSVRRRRAPTAAIATSAKRSSTHEPTASWLWPARTSYFRAQGEEGSVSHHGGMPTARTTAFHPTVGPSVDRFASTVVMISPRLPGRASISSIAGVVQQATATSSAAITHGQTLRCRSRERPPTLAPERLSDTPSAVEPMISSATHGGTNASWH